MFSRRNNDTRNISPTPLSGRVRKRARPNPTISTAAPTINTAVDSTMPPTLTAPTANTAGGLNDLVPGYSQGPAEDSFEPPFGNPTSPHTPPNAPRRAKDGEFSDPSVEDFRNQRRLRKLFNEIRRDFEKGGHEKTTGNILDFTQLRLSEWNEELIRQQKVINTAEELEAARTEEIETLNNTIEGMGRAFEEKVEEGIKQVKRTAFLEDMCLEHGWTKEFLDEAVAGMEEKGTSAKEALRVVENAGYDIMDEE